ncbi:tRNA (guanosine(37)-N1)-methyltransferase TrmD [Brackiella oedipodis]|uniref:tRNA (guanosine(37)-N1)-methyltransferase TrmD n=1 Tax=Brackiella oedipodis TaxID=124225 RepID=UPI00048ABA88|nr:tRNA (guanosine(37)-N1)-methyltransferase TrmD [Brackiella oedipodis]
MRIDVVTLFPEFFELLQVAGVTGRAHQQKLWSLQTWNPRDYTHNIHHTVDDRPYGGGPGMVMMAPPLAAAIEDMREHLSSPALQARPIVLLSPTGKPFDQRVAQSWSQSAGVVLVCGRYEGIDQRFIDAYVTEEYSLGDFVLSGGEYAALAMIDASVRLIPGTLNDQRSAQQDSFSDAQQGLLDHEHYTRPEIFEGREVPAVLRSGNHRKIDQWRRQRALCLTAQRRPDLLDRAKQQGHLSAADLDFLAQLTQDSSQS